VKASVPTQINVNKYEAFDPIPPVAQIIVDSASLLCFDEFQVWVFSCKVITLRGEFTKDNWSLVLVLVLWAFLVYNHFSLHLCNIPICKEVKMQMVTENSYITALQ